MRARGFMSEMEWWLVTFCNYHLWFRWVPWWNIPSPRSNRKKKKTMKQPQPAVCPFFQAHPISTTVISHEISQFRSLRLIPIWSHPSIRIKWLVSWSFHQLPKSHGPPMARKNVGLMHPTNLPGTGRRRLRVAIFWAVFTSARANLLGHIDVSILFFWNDNPQNPSFLHGPTKRLAGESRVRPPSFSFWW